MIRKQVKFLFGVLSIVLLVSAILYKENSLYFLGGIGLSYLIWSFALIFTTPFYWIYQVEEAFYVSWLVGITTYLCYMELYLVTFLFALPAFVQYIVWAREHEEKALFNMVIMIKETKNEEMYELFLEEITKRRSSLRSPYWFSSLVELEKVMKDQEKTNESKSE